MDWAAIKAGSTTSVILILAYTIYILVNTFIKKYRNNNKGYCCDRTKLKEEVIKAITNDLELGKIYPILLDISKNLVEIKNNTYNIKNMVTRVDDKLDKIDNKLDKIDNKLMEKFDGVHDKLNKLSGK